MWARFGWGLNKVQWAICRQAAAEGGGVVAMDMRLYSIWALVGMAGGTWGGHWCRGWSAAKTRRETDDGMVLKTRGGFTGVEDGGRLRAGGVVLVRKGKRNWDGG